jgi:putative transposase
MRGEPGQALVRPLLIDRASAQWMEARSRPPCRENLARRLGRSITADDVTHAFDEAFALRGAPDYIRMDNGPEFVAMAIRDWCRAHGTGTAYIEPGSPWQNPYVESFNGKLRDELLSREVFDTIMEARLLFDDWCDTYIRHRPHSALGYLPPAVFAAAFNRLELSQTQDQPTGSGHTDPFHQWG